MAFTWSPHLLQSSFVKCLFKTPLAWMNPFSNIIGVVAIEPGTHLLWLCINEFFVDLAQRCEERCIF